MLQHLFSIEDDSKKDSLLGIIADKNCRIILDSVTSKIKSVNEIAKDTGICASTVYRNRDRIAKSPPANHQNCGCGIPDL